MSVINAPECMPDAPCIPETDEPEDQQAETAVKQKPSKTPILRRLRSHIFDGPHSPSVTSTDESPPLLTTPHTPKVPTSLRNGVSANDITNSVTGDPFLDGACHEMPSPVKIVNGRISIDDQAPRFNQDSNSPTKEDRRRNNASTIAGSSDHLNASEVHAKSLQDEIRSAKSTPNFSTTPTSTCSTETKRWVGYPKGPEDPQWDEAIRWVKKTLAEEERLEAEEARQKQKAFKSGYKKLQKLQAGKDVVKRGSLIGLIPRKPLDRMTEYEFEAVGVAATSPVREMSAAKKSGLLGAFFTKMLGTKQEKEDQVEEIGSLLDKHRSLQLLDSANPGDLSTPSSDDQRDYDQALRLLKDGGNDDGIFVTSPADATNSRVREPSPENEHERTLHALESPMTPQIEAPNTASVGLGITSIEHEQLAKHNESLAGMSYGDLIAIQRQRQSSDHENEAVYDGPSLHDIAEEESETRSATEGALTNRSQRSGFGCSDSTKHMTFREYADYVNRPNNPLTSTSPHGPSPLALSTRCSVSEPPDGDVRSLSSCYSDDVDSMSEVDEIEAFEGLSGPYQPNIRSFTTEADRYMDLESDLPLRYSQRAKRIISAPLVLPKSQKRDKGLSKMFDDFDCEAIPAPLNIKLLRVKRSSKHFQTDDSKSFVPDRKGSFHARIHELSRMQQSRLGSHPALRITEDDENEPPSASPSKDEKDERHSSSTSSSSDERGIENAGHPGPKHDRIDSGIGMMPDDGIDEGYATAQINQSEFTATTEHPEKANLATGMSSVNHHAVDESPSGDDDTGEAVQDKDLQALRSEVGLPPIRLPGSSSPQSHPHHPFTWKHEKIMCHGIHNPPSAQPKLPQILNAAVSVSSMDAQYFDSNSTMDPTGSPTKTQAPETKMCEDCGAMCCRFANLIVTSTIKPSHDLVEEFVRNKARERVDLLRNRHPNGIEEYDTFLVCGTCGKSFCPTCAKKCGDPLCQVIVCKDCRAVASEHGEVHSCF